MGGKLQSGFKPVSFILTTGGWDCFSDLHLPVLALLHLEKVTKRGSLRLTGIRISQEARVANSRDGHPFPSRVASLSSRLLERNLGQSQTIVLLRCPQWDGPVLALEAGMRL